MYDIFLSYRRDGGHEMARFLYEHFCAKGLECFFDLEELGAGEFNIKLLDSIEDSKNFVLILSPHSLDRCKNEGDWVRSEIEHAIKLGKNIVPLILSGFEWPKDLPASLEKLPFYNGVKLVREYFDASLAKLIELLSLDLDTSEKEKEKVAGLPSLGGAASWLERAFIFLEDEEWERADEYAEKVLDAEPKNGEAYLVKLMASLKVQRREDLKSLAEPFSGNSIYKTLIRYADETLKAEITGYIEHILAVQARKTENAYQEALDALKNAKTKTDCERAARAFSVLGGYKDSAEKASECFAKAEELQAAAQYSAAEMLMQEGTQEALEQAAKSFRLIRGYRDAAKREKKCFLKAEELRKTVLYREAEAKMREGTKASLYEAAKTFSCLGEFKDSVSQEKACYAAMYEIEKEEKYSRACELEAEGTVSALEGARCLFIRVAEYKDSAERAKSCAARAKKQERRAAIVLLAVLAVVIASFVVAAL